MDVKTAIMSGDAEEFHRILSADPGQANALVTRDRIDCPGRTHPLLYVADMLFNGVLPRGKELPLIDALLEAGADVDFRKEGKHETALIGTASLGAEDVAIRPLDASAHSGRKGQIRELGFRKRTSWSISGASRWWRATRGFKRSLARFL
jgi:hypothetical protein